MAFVKMALVTHLQRWLTVLVIVPLLIGLVFKSSPMLFALITIAVSTVTLWEYFRIVYHGHTPPVPVTFTLWSYLCGALVIIAAHYRLSTVMMGLVAIHLIGAGVLSIFRFKTSRDAPMVAVKQVFGVLYIAFFLSFAVLIRNSADGPRWLFFMIWVVAWGDATALYVGSFLGRHKLCPAVSPKKTIEGSIGGLMANVIFGWLYHLLFFSDIPILICLLFAVILGVAGQAGDLFESQFKRAAGVKDSGGLLPGHGGFLDRIDALLFAAPVAYLLKEYLLP